MKLITSFFQLHAYEKIVKTLMSWLKKTYTNSYVLIVILEKVCDACQAFQTAIG